MTSMTTVSMNLLRQQLSKTHQRIKFFASDKNLLPLLVTPYHSSAGTWTTRPSYTRSSQCWGSLRPRYDSLPGWGYRGLSVGRGSWDKKSVSLADEIMLGKLAEKKEDKAAEKVISDTSDGSEGGEDGQKKSKEMPKWQKYTYMFCGVTFGGLMIANCILFSLPDKDEHGNNIEDEFSSLSFPSQYYKRLKNKFFTTKKAIEEPFSDKLLPDPLEPPYHQPKYTVVLELTGLLVTSDWSHKHGWRFQKRPGLDIFLAQIGYPAFEVVIWTVENSMTFFPIINAMDPNNQHIMYRLFRDATRFKNGTHTKDLYSLNRDLKKVIVVDWNQNSTQDNPENALTMQKWTGDNGDRSLIGLAQFLNEVKESDVDDVREVLQYYKQFEDPIEAFRENQRKLEENMKVEEERKAKEKESSRFSSFGGISSFSRFRR